MQISHYILNSLSVHTSVVTNPLMKLFLCDNKTLKNTNQVCISLDRFLKVVRKNNSFKSKNRIGISRLTKKNSFPTLLVPIFSTCENNIFTELHNPLHSEETIN